MSSSEFEQHRNLASASREAIRMGLDLTPWHERMDQLKASNTRIIAIRGAGSVNGIHPDDAIEAVMRLTQMIGETLKTGQAVAVMYDGDDDVPERPDVGAIFGRIADMFDDHSRFTALAAQTEGWYGGDGKPITSAGGTAYETYVFDDTLEGAHSSVTQSQDLVLYSGYEQYFVGPVGPIAAAQLENLSLKAIWRPVDDGPVPVRILRTRNNPALDAPLQAKLAEAADDAAREKIQKRITQRAGQPYGAFFTPDGEVALEHLYCLWFDIQKI